MIVASASARTSAAAENFSASSRALSALSTRAEVALQDRALDRPDAPAPTSASAGPMRALVTESGSAPALIASYSRVASSGIASSSCRAGLLDGAVLRGRRDRRGVSLRGVDARPCSCSCTVSFLTMPSAVSRCPHVAQRVAQLAERERRLELAVAKLDDLRVQTSQPLAHHEERNEQDDGDDGEAECEPRAQGHVQSECVRVSNRGARSPPSRPFDPFRRAYTIVGSARDALRSRLHRLARPLGILGAARAPRHSHDTRDMPPASFVRIAELPAHAGQHVLVRAWVTHLRSSGKIAFAVLRDGTGICQSVFVKSQLPPEVWARFAELTTETSVEITGEVRAEAARAGRIRDRCDGPHHRRRESERLSDPAQGARDRSSCSTTGISGCARRASARSR